MNEEETRKQADEATQDEQEDLELEDKDAEDVAGGVNKINQVDAGEKI